MPFKDGKGDWKLVHFHFVTDARDNHPAFPQIPVRIPMPSPNPPTPTCMPFDREPITSHACDTHFSSAQDTVPTLVMHGMRDEVVPVETSLSLPRKHPSHSLLVVETLDDDHALTASTDAIIDRIEAFFA